MEQSPTIGIGVNRSFGEGEHHQDDVARGRQFTNLINEFIRRARAINAQEVVAEVSAPHVDRPHRLYVLAPRLNPSMPNLHFRWIETDNVLELNGQRVPFDERALRAIGAMLPRLARRIRAQDVPAELVYPSLIDTYAEKAMRTLFAAITFGQGEEHYSVHASAMAISTGGMAPNLWRWAFLRVVFVALSALLQQNEAAARLRCGSSVRICHLPTRRPSSSRAAGRPSRCSAETPSAAKATRTGHTRVCRRHQPPMTSLMHLKAA